VNRQVRRKDNSEAVCAWKLVVRSRLIRPMIGEEKVRASIAAETLIGLWRCNLDNEGR
jgi:hypothetical protein